MDKINWSNTKDSFSTPEWAKDGIARSINWSL